MAGKVIKGLTVEIGGDTTKLGKALENVEKKSRDLSGELGEINRLLKVDPSNTELLAQKQKVLADAVSNTKSKLDTLREAEKQVQAQFERGEVSEAQYRALQREVMAMRRSWVATKMLPGKLLTLWIKRPRQRVTPPRKPKRWATRWALLPMQDSRPWLVVWALSLRRW